MFYFNNNDLPPGLEITEQTLKNWLFTRKSPRNIEGITLPGLLSTRNTIVDTLAFYYNNYWRIIWALYALYTR